MLTARDAARRMGVKVETLYAYVSRGVVESHPAADGRGSLFDERAIETLARRGRPRQSSRSTSLNMLIETSVTSLADDGVRYRGLRADDLTREHTFEDVARLLWTGTLGNHDHGWIGGDVGTGVDRGGDRGLRLHDAIRVGATLAGTRSPFRGPTPGARGDLVSTHGQAHDIAEAGTWLIATIVDSLPHAADVRTPRLSLPDGSLPIRATIAGRLWVRLTPRRPAPGLLAALNAALILMADHELAASTLAVRVAASTWADPASVVTTGLGVLSGPLHGGASRLARTMIDEALRVGPAKAASAVLADRGRAPGFGHKVYVGTDPRATALLGLLRDAFGTTRAMAVIDTLDERLRDATGRRPNVDFALAALSAIGRMPPDSGEAIMAIARIAGWLAHAQEEYAEAPLRFRPRAAYVGAPAAPRPGTRAALRPAPRPGGGQGR